MCAAWKVLQTPNSAYIAFPVTMHRRSRSRIASRNAVTQVSPAIDIAHYRQIKNLLNTQRLLDYNGVLAKKKVVTHATAFF